MLRSQGVALASPLVLILVLALSGLQLRPARGACPLPCLCASDILSCSSKGLEQLPGQLPHSVTTLDLNHNQLTSLGEDSFAALPHLDTLTVAHNLLADLSAGTFRNSSFLRHLDLSSNQLQVVKRHYFLDLPGLEVLLLFDNRITQVESQALSGLGNLRKAYLSHNKLTDFPFFSLQEHSHPYLATLDLSSNCMPRLPLEDIKGLPAAVQRGLFLHNNTLICECSMYRMFRGWERQNFSSVSDYREEHTCLLYGERRASVRFFQHSRFFENCSLTSGFLQGSPPEGTILAYVGDQVLLDCHTSLRGGRQRLTFLWVSPHDGYVAPPGNNGSLRMFTNGSLAILSARAKDSGVYWCMALDQSLLRNETWEVNVTVAVREYVAEPFNTGFTTLLGCVITLVLVLMYLYLTPCHCCCRKQPPPPATTTPSPGQEGSGQSSILTPTPPATTEGPGRKVSNNKHVVFLEPIREVQNGRVMRAPPPPERLNLQPPPHPRGETDSIISVFSDKSIVP